MTDDPAIPGVLRDERSLQQTGASDMGLFGPMPQGGGGLDAVPVRAAEGAAGPQPGATASAAAPAAVIGQAEGGAPLAFSPADVVPAPPGNGATIVTIQSVAAPAAQPPLPAEALAVAGGGSTLPGGIAPVQIVSAAPPSMAPAEAVAAVPAASSAAALPAVDTVDSVRAGAEQLSTALGVLADQLKQGGGAASEDAIAAVSQAATALSGQAGAILVDAVAGAEELRDQAADTLSDARVVATETLAEVGSTAADLVAASGATIAAASAAAADLAGTVTATASDAVAIAADLAANASAAAAGLTADAGAAVAELADDAGETVAQTAEAASDLASSTLDTAVDGAGDAVAKTTEAASDLAGSTLDTVADTAGATAEAAADLAKSAGDAVADTTDVATDIAGSTLEPVTDTASGIVDTVTDTLDVTELAGSDPEGGMATLTALLDDAATRFEVGEPGDDTPTFAPLAAPVSDLALADLDVGDLGSNLAGDGETTADVAAGLLGATEKVGGLLGSFGTDDDAQDGHG